MRWIGIHLYLFSGIPGCAKSALCKELLSAPGGFGDDRPVQSLMGDLIKGAILIRMLSMALFPSSMIG